MARLLKQGQGWRLGWDEAAIEFQGLVGSDDWAIELTEAELNDFCRLVNQLASSLTQISSELMDEEKISCEAESDLVWVEIEGYPHSYSLRFMLLTGRRSEGALTAKATAELIAAIPTLKGF